MTEQLTLTAVAGIPDIQPGDDLVEIAWSALQAAGLVLQDGDVLLFAHKIISKAEGRLVNLGDVVPDARAHEIAREVGKDPRLVALILAESEEISRLRPGLLIVRHRLGFTSANAGIDRSNVEQEDGGETVLLMPLDPDGTAVRLREALEAKAGVSLGIVICDSHGRPFRLGTVGVAVGVAGIPALWDRRGETDLYGFQLQHTDVGAADEIAAAAGILMGQAAESRPLVLMRGLRLPPGDGRARDLVRPKEKDLYR